MSDSSDDLRTNWLERLESRVDAIDARLRATEWRLALLIGALETLRYLAPSIAKAFGG